MPQVRNDLSVYRTHADGWWNGSYRWLRTLQNLVAPRLEYFAGVIGDWRGKAVLDLGCGGGFMAEALAAQGAAVIGVDPSEPALEIAKAHAAANHRSIDYRLGVGENLPLENRCVDCIVCVDVLEHVDDLDRVVEEISRVLKPGGLFLFDTINRTWLASMIFVTFGEEILRLIPRGVHDPAKFIKPSELRARLERRGFEVGRFVGLGPRGLNRRLDFTFGRLPTTAISYMGHARAPLG